MVDKEDIEYGLTVDGKVILGIPRYGAVILTKLETKKLKDLLNGR